MSWLMFAMIFVAFFLTHSLPVRPAIKARLQGALGQTGFTLSYSAVSLIMLAVLIWSAKNAPFIQLWPQTNWQRYVVFLGMYLVCLIVAFAIGQPNPFSFGGTNVNAFDPARPGFVRLTRHPFLLALALWSGLHLLPNGDLAHVILFGVFLGFALLGRWIVDHRKQRQMGTKRWHSLLIETRQSVSFRSSIKWRASLQRIGAATAAFVILLMLHQPIIGVDPLSN